MCDIFSQPNTTKSMVLRKRSSFVTVGSADDDDDELLPIQIVCISLTD